MSHATRQYPNIYLHQPSGRLTQPNRALHQTVDTTFRGQPRSRPGLLEADIPWREDAVATQDRQSTHSSWGTRFVAGYTDSIWETNQLLPAQERRALGPVGGEFEEVDRHVPMSMPKTPRIPYRELSPERLSPLPSPLSLMNFQVPSSSTAWLSSSQQVPYTSRLHHVLCIGSRLEGVSILTDDLFKHVPNEVLHTLATTPTACEVQIVLREGWGMGTVKNSRGVTVADVIRGLNDYLKSPLPWNSVVTRDIERAVGWREGVTGSHQDVVRGVDLLERRVRFGGLADYGEQHGWVLGLISFAPANA